MYVSHKYKLIFLRTPKTASSSLSEFFIRNIPDANAIYTPVEDSSIKGTINQGMVLKYKKQFKYYHLSLEDLIREKVVTREQALNYRTIAVIRNPVDRQKSFYYFYKKWKNRTKPPSLEDYKILAPNGTFKDEPNSAIRQTDLLKVGGSIVGEYWLYEDIGNKLYSLMEELNLPIQVGLPRHKSNFRKNRKDEIEFDEHSINQLKEVFKEDFTLYNELKEKTNAVA